MGTQDVSARLERCFQAIFPEMTVEKIRQAAAESVPAWDSLATVTLLALINEEFGTEFDLDQLEPLKSFQAVQAFLERQSSHG